MYASTNAPYSIGFNELYGYDAGGNVIGAPIPPAPTASLTSSWLVTCSNRNTQITLTWATSGATTVTIDHGIGTVAASGSTNVSFDGNPVYTLTATNTGGTTTSQTTATQASSSSGTILLPAANSAPVFFNGGASYAAGVYLITCCGGAFSWNGFAQGVNANDRKALTSQAFKVFGSQGTQIDAPGNYPGYASVAASDAANQGLTQVFNHLGGPIGVFLNLDSYAAASVSSEPPGFSISGPAPTVLLTANATPVIAGTAVTLSWAVTGTTDAGGVSIDHGIGVVSASGSQNVTVTQTTRYTLTATYAGLTVTTYADVLIGTPSIPQVTTTPGCGGAITFSWSAPSFTTQTLIERSATGGGSGFAQIGSVNAGTTTFMDTPPLQVNLYYYRLRNTDGTNFGPYTNEIAEKSLGVPFAAALNVQVPVQTPVLMWTADLGATSYLVKRGTAPGTETLLYTLPVTTPGQAFTVSDPTATSGVPTYYVVVGVNACGQGAASNEVVVTPGVTTSPYAAAVL